MKILKIFGVVVAVQAAVFMFVFAIPGCRSTSRPVTPPPADTTADAPTVSYPGTGGTGPVAGAPGDVSPSTGAADLNPATAADAPVVSFNSPPANTQRFNPTRPESPAAGVLQSGSVSGVIPAKTYKVVSNDSLWKVAKKHGISIGELAAANNLRSDTPLKVGQKLIIPGKIRSSSPGNGAGSASGETLSYKVKAGESLGSIARRSGTTVATIRSLNPGLKNDGVRAGQELVLPAGPASAAALAAMPDTPVSAGSAKVPAGGMKYIVKPGESVGQIARRFGVTQRDILVTNNIADPKGLRAGQELVIPGVDAPAQPPVPAAETVPVGPVAPPSDTPVAPAPVEAGPVAPDAPPPPVIKVDDGAPVGAPQN